MCFFIVRHLSCPSPSHFSHSVFPSYRVATHSTYTGQPHTRGDKESYGSLGYGESNILFKNLSPGSSKPTIVQGNGRCVGPGDRVLALWRPLILHVGAFRRSDDATNVEGAFQKRSQTMGPQHSYLHRRAANGFRPHRPQRPPLAHRVFVYMLFFDSLVENEDNKVVGGIINGAPFLFTHDTRR